MIAEKLLLTQEEVAKMLGYSTRHVRNLTRAGKLRATGRGKGLRYHIDDVREYARRVIDEAENDDAIE